MKHLGLFEGIGGFSLAARWAGWDTVAWCEINPFCQQILKYHFPEAEGLSDIKQTDFKKYAGTIDVLTGGFPCQPYSAAGKRKGKEDERHLWPEMLRAIREISPRWVVGENVRGLTNWNGGLVFDEVQADLEAQGYEVLPFLLPACAVDAPHRRDRIWFVAYNANARVKGVRRERENEIHGFKAIANARLFGQEKRKEQTTGAEQCNKDTVTDTENNGHKCGSKTDTGNAGEFYTSKSGGNKKNGSEPVRHSGIGNATNTEKPDEQWSGICEEQQQSEVRGRNTRPIGFDQFPTESPICGRDDGISRELDGITFPRWRNESLKGYGNAIVPQVFYQIALSIDACGGKNVL